MNNQQSRQTRPNPNRRPQGQPNRRKSPKNNNKPLIIILVLLIVIAVGVGVFLFARSKDGGNKGGTGGSRVPGFKSTIDYKDMLKKMEADREINDDVIGWMTIPGTNIDQSVLSPAQYDEGNDYYLYREMDHTNHPDMNYQNYKETVLFTSWRNSFEGLGEDNYVPIDRNYVVFGHNWTNYKDVQVGNIAEHTMFAQLPSYTDIDFATENPYIHFSTFDHHMVWKVFAVLYTEPYWQDTAGTDFNYITPGLDDEDFQKLLDEYNERSILKFDTGVTIDDKIITLSTCTRMVEGRGEQQRFVVVARLLREGESDKDAVKVSVNENAKAPIY